jgi:peptide/nickel transport system substrate-binding protein
VRLRFAMRAAVILVAAVISISGASARKLSVAIPGFPTLGLNPLMMTNLPPLYTLAALFDALTWVDLDGQAQPQVAERWESVNDTTWIFYLRRDVVFSDGRPLTADDVVFAVDLLHSPLGLTYTVNVEVPSLQGARAIDPYTVEIRTREPNPFLPQELSLMRLFSPAAWIKGGDEGFNKAPVGSGPYVMVSRGPAIMQLRANPTSWRKPKIEELELIAAPEPTTRVQSILSGRAQIAMALGPDQMVQIEAAGHHVLVRPEPSMINLSFITTKKSPLQDVRVRRALNYAVNKQNIVDTILAGQARVATQTAPAIAFGFDPDLPPYDYDPALAKRLLAEAGYPDGFEMVAEIYAGTSTFGPLVYQQAAADLARVGVKLDVRIVPIPKYSRGLHQGEWEGTAFGVDYNSAPSFDALRGFYRHSCMWKVPWYCDETIMPLLKQALGTFDIEKRRTLTRQVLKHQRDMAPGLLLHDLVRYDAYSNEVTGFDMIASYVPYDQIGFKE